MNILIACEESQRETIELRKKGHDAFSCDILPCSGNHPEWHIHHDVTPYVKGNCSFTTMDGKEHYIDKWDMILAHPPCTYLCACGSRWLNVDRYGEKALKRIEEREKAIKFFLMFTELPCDKIMIENPKGYMSTHWRKPDQIIQPYFFGEPVKKTTCLWLKNLPPLLPTNIVDPDIIEYTYNTKASYWFYNTSFLPKEERSIARSKTFKGVAKAIANQWG